MSPLPAVPLEVERYIGACLISNHNHQKSKNLGDSQSFNRQQQHRSYQNRRNEERPGAPRCGSLDGWAGGLPLISFVNQHRTRQYQHIRTGIEDYSLARLAVHTQGAPLILSKTNNFRKSKGARNQNGRYQDKSFVKNHGGKCDTSGNVVPADAVSVTSDESYGSANSDQCLPRIIKPRKRRKKDRKVPSLEPSSPLDFSSDGTSPDIVNPTGYLTFENVDKEFNFLVPRVNNIEYETPSFEEIEDLEDVKNPLSTTRCQCRYCDPSGKIWDVDKTSYSSFLTPPDRTNVFSFPEFKADVCLVHDLSRLSVREPVTGKSCDNLEHRASTSSNSDLEVSTEIVTSLNGHRDLEIKFFSTTSSADHGSVRTCINREDFD